MTEWPGGFLSAQSPRGGPACVLLARDVCVCVYTRTDTHAPTRLPPPCTRWRASPHRLLPGGPAFLPKAPPGPLPPHPSCLPARPWRPGILHTFSSRCSIAGGGGVAAVASGRRMGPAGVWRGRGAMPCEDRALGSISPAVNQELRPVALSGPGGRGQRSQGLHPALPVWSCRGRPASARPGPGDPSSRPCAHSFPDTASLVGRPLPHVKAPPLCVPLLSHPLPQP